MKKFTIIIPIFNESESIFKLIKEIKLEFKNRMPEIIIVDDGSTDDFSKRKNEIVQKNIRILKHSSNFGKCKAMLTGILEASNELICIIDGDGQNPPYEIKNLISFWKKLDKSKKQKFLICGNRKKRKDKFSKRISSKIANGIRKFILNDDCNDTACALKVFMRSEFLKINYFKNMHRFLPALFKINNCEIFNVLVDDRPRTSGVSKYSFHNRFWIGIIDLINVWIFLKKEKKNG